jgi:integrase
LEDREIILEASQTKNGYSRTLPLDDELVSTLGKMFQTSGPVFSDCNLRKSWAKAIAGIKPGLLIHDLRRSAVRNLVRSGVSEGIVMKISGHRDRSVFERYNVTSNQDLHEAMAKRGLKCKFDASQAVAV